MTTHAKTPIKPPMKAAKNDLFRSVRFSREDEMLIAAIKAATGLNYTSEVLRMGLRALAEKLGVKV